MSRSIEEVDEGELALGEVVVVHFPSLAAVHVLHTNVDPQSSCESADVNVVTLAIHGVHFLQATKQGRVFKFTLKGIL